MAEQVSVDISFDRYADITPELNVSGNWPEHALRIATRPLGRVAIFGDIFADNSSINQASDRALTRYDLEEFSNFPGKFTAIMMNDQGVVVRSSLAGTPTMYYQEEGTRTRLSSAPLNLTKQAVPRNTHIAAQLLSPGTEANTLFGNEACYIGVSRLQGGQTLHVTRHGTRVTTHRSLEANGELTFEEGAYAVGAAIRQAIDSRTGYSSSVTADLSGGVDSSSLAYLAAQNLDTLPVFFAGRSDIDQGDLAYMQRFAKLSDSFRPTVFDASIIQNTFTLDSFLQTPRAAELGQAINATPYGVEFLQAYYRKISEHTSNLHLTGNAGDEIGKVGPFYLSDLVRGGNIGTFAQDTLAWSRLYNSSPLPLALQATKLSYNWQRSFGHTSALLRSEMSQKPPRDGMLSVFAPQHPISASLNWMSKSMRNKMAEVFDQAMRDTDISLTDYMVREGIFCTAQTDAMYKFYAADGGVTFRPQSPFLDDAVINALLSFPAYRRASPHDFKPVLRAGLRNYVPDEILDRKSKGSYDEAYTTILANSAKTIRALLNDSYLADMGIIDAAKVRSSIANIEMLDLSSVWSLERILNAEGWARSVSERPSRTATAGRPTINVQATRASELQGELVELASNVYTAVSPRGSVVVFDAKSNQYFPLDSTQSNILRIISQTNRPDDTASELIRYYKNVDPVTIRSDVATTIRTFVKNGILQPTDVPQKTIIPSKPKNIDFQSNEFTAARAQLEQKPSKAKRLVALGALAISRVALRDKSQKRLAILSKLHDMWCVRDASYEEALSDQLAVQSLPILGRIACAEASYAAALTAAFKRRRIEYHQGVSFGPLAFHAWIEAEGRPVRTPLDGQVLGKYQSFFK